MNTNRSNQPNKEGQLSEKQIQDYKIYLEKTGNSESKADMESGHDLKARQHPYVETDFQNKGEDNAEKKDSANEGGRPVPKMNASAEDGGEQHSEAEEGGKKINKEIPDDQQAS